MDLRVRHEVNVRTDETRALSLTNPWGRSGNDSLSSRNVHRLEEEPGELLDQPLHDTKLLKRLMSLTSSNPACKSTHVVHHLDESNEEDDRGQSVDEEPVHVDDILAEEECSTGIGLFKEVGSQLGNPGEDGKACAGLQDEKSDDLLERKSDDDGWPTRRRIAVISTFLHVQGRLALTREWRCGFARPRRSTTGKRTGPKWKWHDRRSSSPSAECQL